MSRIFFSIIGVIILASALIGCTSAAAFTEQLDYRAEQRGEPIRLVASAKIPAQLPTIGGVAEASVPPPSYTLSQQPAPVVNVAPAAVTVPPAVVNVTTPAPTKVVLSVGEWLMELLAALAPTIVTLGTVLLGLVKGPIGVFLRMYLTEKKIAELVDYALNATAGAAKHRTLSVDVGNEVLATVLQRADALPSWAIKAAGGSEAIRVKAISMLNLDESASSDTLAYAG